MNIVTLVGRLARDPEVRTSTNENGTTIARFTVAVNRQMSRDGQPSADFIGCVAFGKTAEFIGKWFTKGSSIGIQGAWQTGSYTNKDGKTVYTNDCVVNRVEFVGSKSSGKSDVDQDGFMKIPDGEDEELPFA